MPPGEQDIPGAWFIELHEAAAVELLGEPEAEVVGQVESEPERAQRP